MDAKGILKKVALLGDFSSLILPIMIGLVGVLIFVPAQLMGGKLKGDITEQSVNELGGEIQNLLKKPVSGDQYEVEREFQKRHKADKERIVNFAMQSTQRQLLSYLIFPKPKNTSKLVFQEFGNKYCEGVEHLLAGLNAGDCPTEEELNRNLESSRKSGTRGGGSRERSSEDIRSRLFGERMRGVSRGRFTHLSEVDETIKNVLCEQKAKSALVYATPSDVSGYDFWKEYSYYEVETDKAVEDCWHYQLAYWVVEDAVDTIKAMNSGSQSIFASPVKRLMSVGFAAPYSRGYRRSITGRTGRIRASQDRPTYVVSAEQMLTESCTYRLCDEEIDVVHFNLSVVVSSKMVLPFMRELCSAKEHEFRGFSGEAGSEKFWHNQITILESTMEPVDMEDPEHELYRYGDEAVVKLDLTCEYIFRKAAYDEIKPQVVKDAVAEAKEKAVQQTSRRRGAGARRGGAAGRGTGAVGGRGRTGSGASRSPRRFDIDE